jgi:hypothetical protein
VSLPSSAAPSSTNIFRQTSSPRDTRRPNPRSRSNTAHSYSEKYAAYDEAPEPEPVRPSIRSQGRVASSSRIDTRGSAYDDYREVESPPRPNFHRSSTFQGPTAIYRETTPLSGYRKSSIPSDPGMLRVQSRPSNRINTSHPDVFGDPSDDSTINSNSPDHSYRDRSISPATSHGSAVSRTYSNAPSSSSGRKGPPPPPPSRAKKPPPPPPMKRAEISASRY